MKYLSTLIIIFLSTHLLIAQDIEEKISSKKEGHSFIMAGANWNWRPHVQEEGFITEREHDIGMSLQFIRATKKNQAARFTIGLKIGTNQFFGDQYFEEDTLISPLYQHDFVGLHFGLGKEWQKRVQGNLVLFAGGDVTFGASKVILYHRLVTNKNRPTYNSIEDPSGGQAYFGAIMPVAGIRYNIGRFAMSYAVLIPWQFQYTTYASLSYFNTFIRPKHTISFGYHFWNKLKD